jgi:hypothetical protein
LHVGWHVEPDASEFVQVPAAPFAGATDASHEFGLHIAAVSVPEEHELGPDTVKPVLHVGWHVEPSGTEAVQSPTPPPLGGADASQAAYAKST